ncbi:transmembrane emp24 domain-containing protein 5-like [Lampetra planeri]
MAPRAPWRVAQLGPAWVALLGPAWVALLGPAWLALLGPAWLALLGPVQAASLDKTFTFSVAAGQQECFSQPMKRDAILEVEFQVIDGGELDINFVAVSPSGLTVARDEMKQDNTHSIKAVEDGDYTVCFDNTFRPRVQQDRVDGGDGG